MTEQNSANKPEQNEADQHEIGFIEQLQLLPSVMQKRFFKQLGTSVVLAFIIVLMMVYFRSWEFSFGLLFALYLAYAGFDLVWGYNAGRIVRKTVIVLKANIQKEYASASVRELDSEGNKADKLYQLRLYGKKQEISMIDSNVVLEIYIRPNYTADVLAWEITDFTA